MTIQELLILWHAHRAIQAGSRAKGSEVTAKD